MDWNDWATSDGAIQFKEILVDYITHVLLPGFSSITGFYDVFPFNQRVIGGKK